MHAYRDAARLYERALELGGSRDAERFDLLERLAVCAELAGDLGTSARGWREVIDGRRGQGEVERVAEAQQTLGRVLALRGSVARALDALAGRRRRVPGLRPRRGRRALLAERGVRRSTRPAACGRR